MDSMSESALASSDTTIIKDTTKMKNPSSIVARIVLENRMTIAIHESSLPITIGRGLDCDICIPDNHISRQHCEVSSVNGVLCLRDTSVNGTFVGNRKLNEESVTVPEPCKINLGGSVTLQIMPEASMAKRRKKNDRREEDRRQITERRSDTNVVAFERRDDERRNDQRRERSRRTAAG